MVTAFTLPIQSQHYAAAMQRNVRNLVAVVGIIFIGNIHRFLKCIIQPPPKDKTKRALQ